MLNWWFRSLVQNIQISKHLAHVNNHLRRAGLTLQPPQYRIDNYLNWPLVDWTCKASPPKKRYTLAARFCSQIQISSNLSRKMVHFSITIYHHLQKKNIKKLRFCVGVGSFSYWSMWFYLVGCCATLEDSTRPSGGSYRQGHFGRVGWSKPRKTAYKW